MRYWPDRPPWHDFALCRGASPNLFYSEPYATADQRAAKRICNQCAVREVCLEYALARPEKHGVWGGESEAGRRKILRQRRISQVPNDTVLTCPR